MSDFFLEQIKTFKELWENGELINLTIVTEDGGSFKVHMEIMVLQSSYFRKIIESDQSPPWEIVVSGPSKETINTIVNYIYTFKLQLKPDKINELVTAAEQLGIPEVVNLCKNYLTSNMTTENCLSVYNFAKHFNYDDLKASATTFILENFETIYLRNDQYLFLTSEDLISFLCADTLNIKSEETVYFAIMKWIEADKANRSSCFAMLLRCMRVGLCDHKFFEENIWTNPLMTDNEECQHFIFQANQLFDDLQIREATDNETNRMDIFDINHPFLRPRVPNEIIFVMGGWSAGSATNMIETYDIKTKRWFLTPYPDSVPRAYHGMLWHQDHIYVIGGFDGNQCFNSVRRYNPVSHVWEERGCMYVQRCYVSVAVVGDYIYALGGYDGHRRNKSCERYDPSTNQWSMIASMRSIRSDASADALDGKIYVAGGFNGSQVLDTAECYNPETDEWVDITNMNSPRSGVKMLSFRGYLYVIGGFNGNNRLSTVERYDRVTKTWTFVSPMLGPRSNFAVAVMDGYLYAIGGFNGLATISSTEMYDQHTNTWKQTTDLNLNRSALAACKVSNIPTAHEYCYFGAYSQ